MKVLAVSVVFLFLLVGHTHSVGVKNNTRQGLCVSISGSESGELVCSKEGKFSSFMCAVNEADGDRFKVVIGKINPVTIECEDSIEKAVSPEQVLIVDENDICCCLTEEVARCADLEAIQPADSPENE